MPAKKSAIEPIRTAYPRFAELSAKRSEFAHRADELQRQRVALIQSASSGRFSTKRIVRDDVVELASKETMSGVTHKMERTPGEVRTITQNTLASNAAERAQAERVAALLGEHAPAEALPPPVPPSVADEIKRLGEEREDLLLAAGHLLTPIQQIQRDASRTTCERARGEYREHVATIAKAVAALHDAVAAQLDLVGSIRGAGYDISPLHPLGCPDFSSWVEYLRRARREGFIKSVPDWAR